MAYSGGAEMFSVNSSNQPWPNSPGVFISDDTGHESLCTVFKILSTTFFEKSYQIYNLASDQWYIPTPLIRHIRYWTDGLLSKLKTSQMLKNAYH